MILIFKKFNITENFFYQVCFEVKITEELKWEDLIKPGERLARDDHDNSKKDQKQSEKLNTEESKLVEKNEHEETKESESTEAAEKATNNDVTEESENKTETAGDEGESKSTETTEAQSDKQTENGESVPESEGKPVEEKEEEEMETEEIPEPIPTHLFRVGWSLPNTCLQLGEHKFSYGYESSGRFVTDREFSDYGVKFGVGDVVASYVDITLEKVTISYTVNGAAQGVAVTIPRSEFPEENFALFPHVLSRNYAFELNLGSREEAWFANPDEFADYEFLNQVEGKIQGPLRPETRGECEVSLINPCLLFNY